MAGVGDRVQVEGYEPLGYVRWVGEHIKRNRVQVGVQLDSAVPKGGTSGTSKGTKYFECPSKTGVFVNPDKVKVLFKAEAKNDNKKEKKKDNEGSISDPASNDENAKVVERYASMARLAIIKTLRQRKIDYSKAKDVDELRDLAITSDPQLLSAGEEALIQANAGYNSMPEEKATGNSNAASAPKSSMLSKKILPKYQELGRLAIIKILRARKADYSSCSNTEEMKALASMTDPDAESQITEVSAVQSENKDSSDKPAVGRRCKVKGYDGEGTIRFIGNHHLTNKKRIGVEMDLKVGKNNGTIKGHVYFTCEEGHGNLVPPKNISVMEDAIIVPSASEPNPIVSDDEDRSPPAVENEENLPESEPTIDEAPSSPIVMTESLEPEVEKQTLETEAESEEQTLETAEDVGQEEEEFDEEEPSGFAGVVTDEDGGWSIAPLVPRRTIPELNEVQWVEHESSANFDNTEKLMDSHVESILTANPDCHAAESIPGPPDTSLVPLRSAIHSSPRYLTGYLPASAFSCSQPVRNVEYGPHNAILDSTTGCVVGIPAVFNDDTFLQIDLGGIYVFGQFLITGANMPGWAIKSFRISTSVDGNTFTPIVLGTDNTEEQLNEGTIFSCIDEHDTVTVLTLPSDTIGRFFKVSILTWAGQPGIRVDLFGQHIGNPIGLADGSIKDLLCKASSAKDDTTTASSSRLAMFGQKKKYWQPSEDDNTPYIEYSFGTEDQMQLLTAVLYQARRPGKTITFQVTVRWRHDETWRYVKDKTGVKKSFEGTIDGGGTALVVFDFPVLADAIRIYPLALTEPLSFRAEILTASLGKLVGAAVGSGSLSAKSYSCSSLAEGAEAHEGALFDKGASGGWVAEISDKKPWFQIDLGSVSRIFGLVSQGRQGTSNWVSSFGVEVSIDGEAFFPIREVDGGIRQFLGNSDASTPVLSFLKRCVAARYVRIEAHEWNEKSNNAPAALRVGLISKSMGPSLGLKNGRGTLTSEYGVADNARFNSDDRVGWILDTVDSRKILPSPCLQVDLDQVFDIEGILVQGVNLDPDPAWIKLFRLDYSFNGKRWRTHREAYSGHLQLANADHKSTSCVNLTSSCRARFLRLYPLVWHKQIALRIELLGGLGPVSNTFHTEETNGEISESDIPEDDEDEYGFSMENEFEHPSDAEDAEEELLAAPWSDLQLKAADASSNSVDDEIPKKQPAWTSVKLKKMVVAAQEQEEESYGFGNEEPPSEAPWKGQRMSLRIPKPNDIPDEIY